MSRGKMHDFPLLRCIAIDLNGVLNLESNLLKSGLEVVQFLGVLAGEERWKSICYDEVGE